MARSADDEAIALFLSQYVEGRAHYRNDGWLDYLPSQFQVCDDTSFLRRAAKAVAYANLCNQCPSEALRKQTYKMYADAICVGKRALESQAQKSGETLLAVFLLGLYESITSDKPCLLGVHGRGIVSSRPR